MTLDAFKTNGSSPQERVPDFQLIRVHDHVIIGNGHQAHTSRAELYERLTGKPLSAEVSCDAGNRAARH